MLLISDISLVFYAVPPSKYYSTPLTVEFSGFAQAHAIAIHPSGLKYMENIAH